MKSKLLENIPPGEIWEEGVLKPMGLEDRRGCRLEREVKVLAGGRSREHTAQLSSPTRRSSDLLENITPGEIWEEGVLKPMGLEDRRGRRVEREVKVPAVA